MREVVSEMLDLANDTDGWGNVLPPPAWMSGSRTQSAPNDTQSDDPKDRRARESSADDRAPEL